MKMVNETRKILGDYSIRITATTVRVPVFNGHSESINVEFEKQFDLEELKEVLRMHRASLFRMTLPTMFIRCLLRKRKR